MLILSLLGGCFVPWVLFLWIFGECGGLFSWPVQVVYSQGIFAGAGGWDTGMN